ncbi:nitroreductase [Dyadobacter psychrotolerans]|uniref:Nitroreductase n=1 Tax=Dyadobacter psychrotolerans TaxID=2541721 RepID=A0A4R5DMY6_9BACT|nr:nitroreductase [Dyadobacter psychrotolerans]
MDTSDKSFQQLVRTRHSCRAFLSKPVPETLIYNVLQDAQQSPSNCNTQPWNVHIVSGEVKNTLSEKLIEAYNSETYSSDFSFDTGHFTGRYKERQFAQGKTYYEALGVAREDKEGRKQANLYNYKFYNAPHAALLFMPSVGDHVRVAGDVGMYAQTFLLSLTAHGLAGVPQTVLGMFADVVRKHLGISAEYKMLFGISFGYEDLTSKANSFRFERDPVLSNVTFHQ